MKKGTQMHYCALPQLFSALGHVICDLRANLSKVINVTAYLKEELDKIERLRTLVQKQLEKLETSAEY